jgi:hypothetical protein
MRRALIGFAITALTVLSVAGPASAAPGQVTHFTTHGILAEADWFTSSATSFTDTLINASQSQQVSLLFVDQFTGNRDANGNVTTYTQTSAEVTSGFSFAIDKTALTSASVSGPGLPATTCTFDADFNEIGCNATTIDVNATWTGQGPLGRSVGNLHFKTDGFSVTSHSNGTSRDATATGTAGGLTLNAADLQFADLRNTHENETTICTGSNC